MLKKIFKMYFVYAAAVIAIFFIGMLINWHNYYTTIFIRNVFPISFVASLILLAILFGRTTVSNADVGTQRAYALKVARVSATLALIFVALFAVIYFASPTISREYLKHNPQKSHNFAATIYENCRDCDYLDSNIYRYCTLVGAGSLLVASILFHVSIMSYLVKPHQKQDHQE